MLTCEEVVCVLRVLVAERHVGVGYVSGNIFWRYSFSSGHLVLNCASILRVCLGSFCSSFHILDEMSFNTLLSVEYGKRHQDYSD